MRRLGRARQARGRPSATFNNLRYGRPVASPLGLGASDRDVRDAVTLRRETRLSGCAPNLLERDALQNANKLNNEQRELTLSFDGKRIAGRVKIVLDERDQLAA